MRGSNVGNGARNVVVLPDRHLQPVPGLSVLRRTCRCSLYRNGENNGLIWASRK